jgi:hypothetical protein
MILQVAGGEARVMLPPRNLALVDSTSSSVAAHAHIVEL